MNSEAEYYRFHREDVAQPESPEFSSFQTNNHKSVTEAIFYTQNTLLLQMVLFFRDQFVML